MNRLDYWKECLSDAAEENGVTLTVEQLDGIAESMQLAAGSVGQAFSDGPPDAPRETETDRLRKELAAERAKEKCSRCNGAGSLRESFGPSGQRFSIETCDVCGGAGRR